MKYANNNCTPLLGILRTTVLGSLLATSAPYALANDTATTAADAAWEAVIETLQTLPAELLAQLPPAQQRDPLIRQLVTRQVLQAFVMSSIDALGPGGDYPVFLPSLGNLLNVGQPNADTLYRAAEITPGGVYRLRGKRGSLNRAVLGQAGSERPTQDAGANTERPLRRHLDLGSLQVDKNGYFDLLLSERRPAGYTGDWWELHPATYRLSLRLVSADWAGEEDPTLAIERLDVPATRPRSSAAELEQRLRRIPAATTMVTQLFIDHAEELRQQGYVNKLKSIDESKTSGLLEGQFYYEGIYEIAADEALILEAKHPAQCDYRSILLTNEIYQTLDWYNRQSSLNPSQAQPDADGVLRIVLSASDPGVPNWLDTSGHPFGVVQGRWTNCDAQPVPSVRKVALAQLREYLHPQTPHITAEEREAILRERRAAYQQRAHW